MDLLKALVLGILQGATEFLPVSSSGHLVLVPWWFDWDKPPLIFDVVVHLGTLVAVLVYFWRDLLTLLRAGWTALRTRSTHDPDARLLAWLVLGTIPAVLAGLLLEDLFLSVFARPPLVALFLLVTAGLLVISEHLYRARRTIHDVTARDALMIGMAQAVAIFPGISRSGSTIVAGMARNLSRSEAARFSFLLAIPVILGAGMQQMIEMLTGGVTLEPDMVLPLIAGFVSAAAVGYLCIWFLLRLVQRHRLYGFAVYCAGFGTLSLLVALLS